MRRHLPLLVFLVALFASAAPARAGLPVIWNGVYGTGEIRNSAAELNAFVTRYDQVVTPYTSAFLSGAKTIVVQNQCILDLGDHLSMPYDHIVGADVLTALDPAQRRGFLCTPIAPTAGGLGQAAEGAERPPPLPSYEMKRGLVPSASFSSVIELSSCASSGQEAFLGSTSRKTAFLKLRTASSGCVV